jgi:hypothetical protein
MCLVGDRRQHAERVDAAAIHSPETVLIGCLAGACGFGSLDCELIRDFSRCGRPRQPMRIWLYATSGFCGCAHCWPRLTVTRPPTATIGIATATWRHPSGYEGHLKWAETMP